jgi:hypothetical protein
MCAEGHEEVGKQWVPSKVGVLMRLASCCAPSTECNDI